MEREENKNDPDEDCEEIYEGNVKTEREKDKV